MRMSPRLAAATVPLALALVGSGVSAPGSSGLGLLGSGLLGPAAAAAAVTDPTADSVVGGGSLGARGVVVAEGAPGLPEIAAASWLVADVDTGEVLAAKDPHGRYAPASTLKALTALTLIPELPADHRVEASFDDVAVEGSKVGLVERTSYPVHELFSALLMVSGNDAANVLASAAGGQERTAAMMNAKAASLGALDTHAVNPHGLDAQGQLSSAYDLALIARAGLNEPDFTRYATTLSSSVAAPGGARIEIRNKNRLLTAYPGALAGKNGFTTAARASFVGAAERDGRRLVVTLMKAVPQVFGEAEKLFDWGFAARGVTPVGTLVTVEPAPPPPQPGATTATAGASALTGATRRATTSPHTAPNDGPGLPVTLAGMALAVAAMLAVRVRPAGARSRTARSRPRGGGAAARRSGSRPSAARPPAQRQGDRGRSALRR